MTPLFVQIASMVFSLALLLAAGDFLVRGAVGAAQALRIPPVIVGLTVVAFGTSTPEMFVTVQAVLAGNAGIALGNIIGSNIANVFLVLGLPAIIYPISAHVQGLRRHGVVMLAATAIFATIAYVEGRIDTASGGVLFAGIILYIAYIGRRAAKGDPDIAIPDDPAEFAPQTARGLKTALFLALGLIGLPIGAHLLVTNGAAFAGSVGVREEVVGLTIVAFGTSLPELATIIAAAFHRKSDVAMGGVIGSNIFNIFAVGGLAGLVGVAHFDATSLSFDIPVMIAAAVAVSAFIFLRRDIGRISGAAMCLAYAGFIAALAFGI